MAADILAGLSEHEREELAKKIESFADLTDAADDIIDREASICGIRAIVDIAAEKLKTGDMLDCFTYFGIIAWLEVQLEEMANAN